MQHKKTPATKKNTAKAHKTQQKLNETKRKYKKKLAVFLGNSFRRDRNQNMRRIALRLKRSRGFIYAVREKKMQQCVF